MARQSNQEPLDIAAMLRDAGEKLNLSVREPNILLYQPHHKQEVFHKSDAFGRLYIGGNRSGKTYGAIVEDIWWATGTHPYRETPRPPVRGRVVGVDFKKGVRRIILPLFKQLIVPSQLKGGNWDSAYSLSDDLLTFKNGSTIEFMSYEQDTNKFAGTSRHFIHYDEEPPKNVYDECQMRIMDTEGSFWISMTPVDGMTWLYESMYEPITLGDDSVVIEEPKENYGQVIYNPTEEILLIEVDADENPYLSVVGRERAMRGLDEDDAIARKSGKFVEMSGLVYKVFDPKVHVIPEMTPPIDWEWYSSIDHGWNNPTATLWSAVAPNGDVYTFSEHYQANMTIEQHATVMHLRETMWGREPDMRVGDPAMKQTSAITGTSIIQEYGDRGIFITVDNIPRDVAIGVARIQQYLRIDPTTHKPKWFITENCINLIREMRKLRWKKYATKKMQYENNKREEIHKKDDHACDAMRYFFTCMPELSLADYVDPKMPPVDKPRVDTNYGLALLRAVNEGNAFPQDLDDWEIHEGIDLADMAR